MVVEDDSIQLPRVHIRLTEAVVDRVAGESRIVLDPAEPLLLRSGRYLAVANDRSGRVVVKSRDTEHVLRH